MNADTQPISELAEVNPRVDLTGLTSDSRVSFIPMSDVSEFGQWANRQERYLHEVRAGYTAFAENDVLFAKITPCMENGKGAHALGLMNGIGFGSTEFHVLRVREQNDARFLYHWLQAPRTRTRAVAFMGGSAGQQRVQPDFFLHYRVPRIEPDQQPRIAAVLDTVDAAITKTEAVIVKLKQVRAGLLHDLLTRGLDERGELRDSVAHPEHFKDSPLGMIPREWEPQTLQEAADWFSGGTPSRAQSGWWQGSVPFLTPKDMKLFEISDTVEHLKEDAARIGSRIMPAETVFIVVRGMILAHTFPVCLSSVALAFNQDIKAIRGRGKLSTRFLGHWFNAKSSFFLRKTTEATHGTKKLDTSELYRVHIGIPLPDEQHMIIERLEQLDALIELDKAKQEKLKLIKSGLMADLLTGRVPVPPLDEVNLCDHSAGRSKATQGRPKSFRWSTQADVSFLMT